MEAASDASIQIDPAWLPRSTEGSPHDQPEHPLGSWPLKTLHRRAGRVALVDVEGAEDGVAVLEEVGDDATHLPAVELDPQARVGDDVVVELAGDVGLV